MKKKISIQEKYPYLFVEEPKDNISKEAWIQKTTIYFLKLEKEIIKKYVELGFQGLICLILILMIFTFTYGIEIVGGIINIIINIGIVTIVIVSVYFTLKIRKYTELRRSFEEITHRNKVIRDLFKKDLSSTDINPILLSDIANQINTLQKTLHLISLEISKKSIYLNHHRRITEKNKQYFDLLKTDQKWLYTYTQGFLADLKNWLSHHQKELINVKQEVEQVVKNADSLNKMIVETSMLHIDSQIQNVEKVRTQI